METKNKHKKHWDGEKITEIRATEQKFVLRKCPICKTENVVFGYVFNKDGDYYMCSVCGWKLKPLKD